MEGSAFSAFGFVAELKKRAAISAAMDDGLAASFGAGAAAGVGMDFGAPLPRAIPCAASTFSTTRAIAARSTPPVDATAVDAAGFFSSCFTSAEDGGTLGVDTGEEACSAGMLTFSCTASGSGEFAAPAMRWSAGTVRCSTPRVSHAMRFTFIKCCGPILSEVMFPPGAPQPSVIAGKRFVE